MTRYEKFLKRLMEGEADQDISFAELCIFFNRLGFVERIRGDHHIFTREGIEEIINLQPKRALAKPYQVKQVLKALARLELDNVIEG